MAETIKVPAKFGGLSASRPHQARCKACGDFGTLATGERRVKMAEILEHEMPCLCEAGEMWREAAQTWFLPLVPKCGGKAAA